MDYISYIIHISYIIDLVKNLRAKYGFNKCINIYILRIYENY